MSFNLNSRYVKITSKPYSPAWKAACLYDNSSSICIWVIETKGKIWNLLPCIDDTMKITNNQNIKGSQCVIKVDVIFKCLCLAIKNELGLLYLIL